MDDDLGALRRQQKEERRRKREEERRMSSSRPKGPAGMNSGTLKPPRGAAVRVMDEERKKKYEKWKDKKKTQEGIRLIRQLYPDTIAADPVTLKASQGKASSLTAASPPQSEIPASRPEALRTVKVSNIARRDNDAGGLGESSPAWIASRPQHQQLGEAHGQMSESVLSAGQEGIKPSDRTAHLLFPASSPGLSMSTQSSPAVRRVLFQPGKSNDETDDDDLCLVARRLEKQRELLKSQQQQSEEDDLLVVARALEQKRKREEEGDLVAIARKLEEKKKRDTEASQLKREQEGDEDPMIPLSGGSENSRDKGQEHNASCDDDLVALAKKLEMKRKRKREQERSWPHNPIAAMRRREEMLCSTQAPENEISGETAKRIRHVHGSCSASVSAATKQKAPAVDDEGIWGDTSGSEGDLELGDSGYCVARKKNGTNTNTTKRRGRGSANGKEKSRDTESLIIDGYNPLDGIGDEDENQLKPDFANPKLGPPSALEPLVLPLPRGLESSTDGADEAVLSDASDEVPAAINRYLTGYQREGVAFMHSAVTKGKGVILGDDMGLGKTVQVIGLLAALMKKSGTGKDMKEIKQRRWTISQEMKARREAADKALLQGTSPSKVGGTRGNNIKLPEHAPILVVVPPSVIKNWVNEFNSWGHFAVAVFQDKERSVALERIRTGMDEIMVCGRALFSQDASFDALNSIKWKLIIVDEYHEYKNHKSRAYECLANLKSECLCPLVGMTGTLMQNNHKELWNLVDLAQPGLLGSWRSFEMHTARPIKLSRTKTAQEDVIELGRKRQQEFTNALRFVYLERKKSEVLSHKLTKKDEKVIFCELSEVQKQIYRHVMTLPDYHLLRTSNAPCDCGVNQKFFIGYKKMRTMKEKVDYQRRHKKELVLKRKCCYQIPLNPRRDENGQPLIDPDAILWRTYHPGDHQCDKCPTCILLPALQKLYKICSHASLLQVSGQISSIDEGSADSLKAKKTLDFAKVALAPDLLHLLPGGSYFREDGIMDDHTLLSGKMETLDKCLRLFYRRRDRVLIFSYSTATLDLIQHYVRSKGYSFLRLDGSTQTKKRQSLINQFQSNDSIFLFLISTKAGGLGLNLTAANRVIVFDVNWNPSYDEQAQDRAFRIGQNRDVDVIRLVARGTVEELMYVRQVYKVQLKKETLGTHNGASGAVPQQARLFRGVAGDVNRKGELFGLENLLKFKDGSFMADMWKSSQDSVGDKNAPQMHDVSKVSNALSTMTVDEIDRFGDGEETVPDGIGAKMAGWTVVAVHGGAIGSSHPADINDGCDMDQAALESKAIHHEDFFREDRGGAALKQGDEGFDEEMGGASQMVHVTCAVACDEIEDDDESINIKAKPPSLDPIQEFSEDDGFGLKVSPNTAPKSDEKQCGIVDDDALSDPESKGQPPPMALNQLLRPASSNPKGQPPLVASNQLLRAASSDAKGQPPPMASNLLRPASTNAKESQAAPVQVAVMGIAPGHKTGAKEKPLFSALDLHVPSYKKKRKRSGRKNG